MDDSENNSKKEVDSCKQPIKGIRIGAKFEVEVRGTISWKKLNFILFSGITAISTIIYDIYNSNIIKSIFGFIN